MEAELVVEVVVELGMEEVEELVAPEARVLEE
jgi:hypothetical protein